MVSWTIHSRARRRLLSGHPWVFSNELLHSPRGISPGELVQINDENGSVIGFGPGNPHSLIAARLLERGPTPPLLGLPWLGARLSRAWLRRADRRDQSCRVCYGEADGLPGLVVDRFVHPDGSATAVLQLLSAGMEALIPADDALAACVQDVLGCQTVILTRGASARSLEGLSLAPPVVVGPPPPDTIRSGGLLLSTSLLNGQKTGFFLDQSDNIELVCRMLQRRLGPRPSEAPRPLRVLDLFCYVGQWGAHLAALARQQGLPCEVVVADASAAALERAAQNARDQGASVQTHCADLIDGVEIDGLFDVVICDPPALVRGRKDLPQGSAAYGKVNRAAMVRVRPGGLFFSSSCSSHVDDAAFQEILEDAAARARVRMQWLSWGWQATDHPRLSGFPQGWYLKGLLGQRWTD